MRADRVTGERSPLLLLDGITRQPVEATLIEDVSQEEVRQTDALWKPFLRQMLQDARAQGLSPDDLPEHAHWVWERKWRAAAGSSQFLGVECGGEMQALMVIRADKACRIPDQAGLPLIYVDYLAAAPWNLAGMVVRPRFRGCGYVLIIEAIRLSRQKGYNGRVGLHSLPQAEDFYRKKCGMTDLGQDMDYEGLHYLEMTTAQAQMLAEGAG